MEAVLSTNITSVSQALTVQEQAQKLREEAELLRRQVDESEERRITKEIDNIDRWIDHLLVNVTIDENTQMLNSVEHVMALLRDGRYSQEQVNKMFRRLCDTSGRPQSRSNCSPLIALLVDATGKLDEIDRQDNPNKRWSGKVERELRRRLFAMDWGIDLEKMSDEDDNDSWGIRWNGRGR